MTLVVLFDRNSSHRKNLKKNKISERTSVHLGNSGENNNRAWEGQKLMVSGFSSFYGYIFRCLYDLY